MDTRFQDTAAAYRTHRAVTNEAEAISKAVCGYAANDLQLSRSRLRILDAGTGDGQVLKGIADSLLRNHRERPCEMLLKEYDFHHIEVLLQNIAPLLRRSPSLTLFVTNRAFRKLQDFADDLCVENTVCFDDIAGYRLLAMGGTATLLSQGNSLRFSFPSLEGRGNAASAAACLNPLNDLWNGERMLTSVGSPFATPALVALGDEIRAREIYDELAAVGADGKRFTVTIARQENAPPAFTPPREFFWDLAIVSHAFNRDKDPGWICRNILEPLYQGLSVGGVLVNVHAADGGAVSELKEEIFGSAFPFGAAPGALAKALETNLDNERFQLLPHREVLYQGHITAEVFTSMEPWERELALHQMAVSVAYHLQIPDEAWIPRSTAVQAKIRRLLEREKILSYSLSIVAVKRRE